VEFPKFDTDCLKVMKVITYPYSLKFEKNVNIKNSCFRMFTELLFL
jgi:hypothetical protein